MDAKSSTGRRRSRAGGAPADPRWAASATPSGMARSCLTSGSWLLSSMDSEVPPSPGPDREQESLRPHQADATPPPAGGACGYQLPAGPGPLRIRVDGQRPEPAKRAPRHRDQRPRHPARVLLPHGDEAPARIRGKPHGEEQRRDRTPGGPRTPSRYTQRPERRVRHRSDDRQITGSHRPDRLVTPGTVLRWHCRLVTIWSPASGHTRTGFHRHRKTWASTAP